jgi:hypothetical protein
LKGIKNNVPDLSRYFVDELIPYEPGHPDSLSNCHFPASVEIAGLKPDGD